MTPWHAYASWRYVIVFRRQPDEAAVSSVAL